MPCKGIVAYSQHEWKWEEMLTREPKEDEFLVEMIATGVCHTDISGYGGIYPRVLGHEGNFIAQLDTTEFHLTCEQAPDESSNSAHGNKS